MPLGKERLVNEVHPLIAYPSFKYIPIPRFYTNMLCKIILPCEILFYPMDYAISVSTL